MSKEEMNLELKALENIVNFENVKFDGDDYIPSRDDIRLTGQIQRVWNCMVDGKWRTLYEISKFTGDPEASVSAQLRHLRKKRFGSHEIEKNYINDGLYQYRLIVKK